MNTKTVIEQLNISSKALRIYENMKIVVPERGENNYRNYKEEDVLKLRQLSLLKEMGVPLKNIKELLDKEVANDNKIIRGLALQLKAVENKVIELENIKNALKQGINEALTEEVESEAFDQYFDKVTNCLNVNKANRLKWIDKWGFDAWAENYDASVKNSAWDELRLFEKYDYVLERVIEAITNLKAKKIIDIGCGTGNIYEKFVDKISYTGVDQSIEMLLKAKNKFPEVELRLGNFLEEPFVEDEFDAVISTYAFHHLKQFEKERAIKLLLKYLTPGGKIIIADLMFLNESERSRQRDYFYEQGRQDLWEIIQDEYYSDIEKIKAYVEFLNCRIKFQHLINFTWIIEIEKIC